MEPSEIIAKLRSVLGAENVLTEGDATPYSKDWMGHYISRPLAVLRPANTAEVSAVMKIANAHAAPVVPIGGNTGLVGGTMAEDALMVSLERLNQIRKIRPETRVAVVEAGVILSNLHDAVADHGLAFPLFC